MDKKVYDAYVQILESELLKALGCTEPGAVAFTAAKAVEVLGKKPERMEVNSSGNIIKNVKGVIVPNSGGLRGIAPAAILGALVAKPELELEILEGVTDADREEAKQLLAQEGYCKSTVEEGEGNLYVEVTVWAGDDSAKVIIRNNHTNIELIEKNGRNGVRLYYFCDYGRRLLDDRPGWHWHVLWRSKVTRPPWPDLPATIYEYNR